MGRFPRHAGCALSTILFGRSQIGLPQSRYQKNKDGLFKEGVAVPS